VVFVALGTIYVGSEILLGEHSLWTKGILRVTFHGFGLTRKKMLGYRLSYFVHL
jgi:hypothetical protein